MYQWAFVRDQWYHTSWHVSKTCVCKEIDCSCVQAGVVEMERTKSTSHWIDHWQISVCTPHQMASTPYSITHIMPMSVCYSRPSWRTITAPWALWLHKEVDARYLSTPTTPRVPCRGTYIVRIKEREGDTADKAHDRWPDVSFPNRTRAMFVSTVSIKYASIVIHHDPSRYKP